MARIRTNTLSFTSAPDIAPQAGMLLRKVPESQVEVANIFADAAEVATERALYALDL
jgi:hypothetical protein